LLRGFEKGVVGEVFLHIAEERLGKPSGFPKRRPKAEQ